MTFNPEQQALYDKVVDQDFSKLLILGEAGTGKAQPLYSKVLTPTGWTTMGQIKPGDQVLTPKGTVAKVVQVFPQGVKDIYEITMHDGAKARACEDHLWEVKVPEKVWQRGCPGTNEIVDTKFIKEFLEEKVRRKSTNNLSIGLIGRINTPPIDLPLDPYVLGCLIGDGGLTNPTRISFTSEDSEIVDMVNKKLPSGYELRKNASKYGYGLVRSKTNTEGRNKVNAVLKSLNVSGKMSHEKEIPEVYMSAGTEQKIELLRGLFDTDGTSTENCSVSLSTSSKILAEQVQELVWSLGGIANITEKQPYYTHNGEKRKGRINYRVWVRTKNPREFFHLTRKIERCPRETDGIQFCRRIKKVELVDKYEAKCIMIDDPDHLYITDGYIVTHNTYSLCKAVSELARRGTEGMVICAPTHLARLNLHAKLDKDIAHIVETTTVASLLLKFGIQRDDGTVHFTAGKLDKIDKYSVIALDECSMISEADYMMFMQSKAKVIFLGDHKQLPPVMAKSCEGKMNTHQGTGNLEVFRLVQQMRQQGVIHAAAERNRDKAWFPEQSETGAGGESITVHDSDRAMVDTMVNAILNDPRGYNCVPHYRYIAYKNDQVRRVGKEIRDRVLGSYFGFNTGAIPFIVSEIIMLRENKKSIGYNGELVTVTNVKKDTGKYRQYPWDTYELVLKGSLGTGGIRTLPPCQYPQFEAYISSLQSKLRRHQIAGEAASASNTLAEIKRLQAQWTVVQYVHAITTHKSQGSTIENVYLNTLSFAQAPNRRALLYVGISRASKTLHTVRVPARLQLRQSEVNAAYRAARATYEDVAGESYRKVIRYLNVPTGTLTGKQIVTEYLLARVADLRQAEG